MMLRRSKGAVLDIGVDGMADGSTLKEWWGDWGLVEELCREAHRSRDLHLNLIGAHAQGIVAHLAKTDAPLLERFYLHMVTGYGEQRTTFMLPGSLLGSAPRLEDLGFNACRPPWDASIFKDLTRLSLVELMELSPTPGELWCRYHGI